MADIVQAVAPADLPANVGLVATQFILGLPWYYWAFVAAAVIVMFIVIGFVYFYWKMGPCMGYWSATRKNLDMGILVMRSGRAKMIALRYIANVFNAINLPLSWIQLSPTSHRFGETNMKIVLDGWGITYDPKLGQAVKTIIETWNIEHRNKDGVPYDQITDYYDLMDKLKKGQIDDPVVIPAVFEVPTYEIIRFLQKIDGASFEGHVKVRVAEEVEKKDGNKMPNWAKLFLLGLIGIIITALIAYMIIGKTATG